MGAVSSVALGVPIPVNGEGTRRRRWALLTRGPDLGQWDAGNTQVSAGLLLRNPIKSVDLISPVSTWPNPADLARLQRVNWKWLCAFLSGGAAGFGGYTGLVDGEAGC